MAVDERAVRPAITLLAPVGVDDARRAFLRRVETAGAVDAQAVRAVPLPPSVGAPVLVVGPDAAPPLGRRLAPGQVRRPGVVVVGVGGALAVGVGDADEGPVGIVLEADRAPVRQLQRRQGAGRAPAFAAAVSGQGVARVGVAQAQRPPERVGDRIQAAVPIAERQRVAPVGEADRDEEGAAEAHVPPVRQVPARDLVEEEQAVAARHAPVHRRRRRPRHVLELDRPPVGLHHAQPLRCGPREHDVVAVPPARSQREVVIGQRAVVVADEGEAAGEGAVIVLALVLVAADDIDRVADVTRRRLRQRRAARIAPRTAGGCARGERQRTEGWRVRGQSRGAAQHERDEQQCGKSLASRLPRRTVRAVAPDACPATAIVPDLQARPSGRRDADPSAPLVPILDEGRGACTWAPSQNGVSTGNGRWAMGAPGAGRAQTPLSPACSSPPSACRPPPASPSSRTARGS